MSEQITTFLLDTFQGIPAELAIMIMAALPVTELRGALPIGILVYKLPLVWAMFWTIIGNMLPVYFLLIFFEKAANWIRPRSEKADQFLTWLFDRTRRKLEANVEKYGHWALTLFVAIPLPVTGAWTGALAAFVFGMPKQKAFLAILFGAMIASVIVAAITLGADTVVRRLFFV